MSKKLTLSSVAIVLCLVLVGCSREENNNENRVNEVIIQEESVALQTIEELDSNSESEEELTSNMDHEGIDVDLTVLSSTLVYAEIYNIMFYPENYIGKTVKMRGQYYSSYYEETGEYYHYVVIEDAIACCQQGVEFIWNGEHIFPDDYPSDGTEVEIIGMFDTYEELGRSYLYIATDEIKVY